MKMLLGRLVMFPRVPIACSIVLPTAPATLEAVCRTVLEASARDGSPIAVPRKPPVVPVLATTLDAISLILVLDPEIEGSLGRPPKLFHILALQRVLYLLEKNLCQLWLLLKLGNVRKCFFLPNLNRSSGKLSANER